MRALRGGHARPSGGILAATTRRPEGPQAVLDVWAEQLIALAWQAVLDTAAGLAARPVPTATANRWWPPRSPPPNRPEVLPQARHDFDRVLTGRAVIS
jgi:hypothetical protein